MAKKRRYKVKKIDFNKPDIKKEVSVYRMMTKHAEAGYIIISAFTSKNTRKENFEASKDLRGDIINSGFSFTPVWGGWVYDDDGVEKVATEKSFIVFNYKRTKPQKTMDELEAYAKEWCKDYTQWAYLIHDMGIDALSYFKDEEGNISETFKELSPTKAVDQYFTSLTKSERTVKRDKTRRSFTLRNLDTADDMDDEIVEEGYNGIIYVPHKPATLAEAYSRQGEIFFKW